MSDIYKIRFNGNTLCSQQTRQFVHKYKSFKWVLSGRWNQGSGNTGATATYMQWDELGIGFDGGTVHYGPTYWTYDSYTLDGTPWDSDTRMPPVLLGGSWGTESSKFDASNFVELTVYFHTADNSAILPTRVGLISANNQNSFQSSTPLHFMLYGLNEDANEYELLIDVNAANVNKSNNTETLVSTGFTYHYTTVTDTWPLSFKYKEPVHMIEYVNLGDTEYSSTQTVSLIGMPATSDYNYLVFKFDAYYSARSSYYASDIILRANDTYLWRSRLHHNVGLGFVGITGKVTGWTTEAGQNVTSKTQDGVSYRISSLWQINTYVNLKLIQDRTTYNCYFYINDTLIGYASMSVDLLTCNKLELTNEVNSSAKVKNVRVAAFSTLAAAQAYNG